MGLIGQLRYVLITDALLETLNVEQIRAVMAHEIGHVRRRHMAWLVICLIASFALAGAMMLPIAFGLDHLNWLNSQAAVDGGGLIMSGIQLIIGLAVFGWVCRRFERQADTFAVQHLSQYPPEHKRVPSTVRDDEAQGASSAAQLPSNGNPLNRIVRADAVHSMCDALDAIARLNAIEHHRPSWRHGSIAWRMEYLVSLIGQPLAALAIDRTVARIKTAAAIIVCGAVAYSIFAHMHNGGFSP
jgi:Zn-dependent protease with chaperone function